MGSYAALREMGAIEGREREGIVVNNRVISYFQLESVLHSYPKVLEAGVIVQCQNGENEILKVYLALEESFSDDTEREKYCQEVERFIRQKFSIGMQINVLIRNKLPMTRSGKILRSVLYDF
jgi:acyl-coenzyme A synthetase/AMP-(fatty) acid ligase